MSDPISIVIPAFNQLQYCEQCIESIRRHTTRAYRLILVDNGSTDGVAEYFDSVAGAVAVHAGENRGFAGGVNLGLERATGHTVVLNNDTLVPRGWLERLEAALLHADDVGMVGPMSNWVSGPQQIPDLNFTAIEEVNAYSDELALRNAGRYVETDRLVGFCLLIRDRALEQVGGFDESFGLGNYEDDDYCLRVRAAGYRLCIAEDAFVFHYGNRTFLGMGLTRERWSALMTANRRRFAEKWRLEPAERVEAAQESERLNAQARAAAGRGEFDTAVRLLKQAIEAFPLLETNFSDLGAVLWEMGERDKAYESFERAVRMNPANVDARANLLDAARVLGREAGAERLLTGRGEREDGP